MISVKEQKTRTAIWEDDSCRGIHSIYHDELVLSAENVDRLENGNWVRVLELDLEGKDNIEIGRVFWHINSSLDDLEKVMRAMADARFPITTDEPVDPEEL